MRRLKNSNITKLVVISGANMESNRSTNTYHVGGTGRRDVGVLLSIVVLAT